PPAWRPCRTPPFARNVSPASERRAGFMSFRPRGLAVAGRTRHHGACERKTGPMAGESFAWNYDRSELIADGIVHGVGVVLALAGAVALVACAAVWSSGGVLAAVSVYGAGLVLALGISCAYNVWPVSAVKWRLRRFDHASIFVLIAATYTPFLQRGV